MGADFVSHASHSNVMCCTYEYDRNNREDHDCFVLLFGSDGLISIYACF
jgi:hypothetical protein